MNQAQNVDRALGWDDAIEHVEDKPFVVLPAGEVDFVITNIERKAYQPGPNSKIQDCRNMAVVHVKLTNAEGETTTVKNNLYLHTKCMGMLCQFFVAVGQRQHGDKAPLAPNWNGAVGATGRAKIKIRSYQKDGETKHINEVDRFLDPVPAQPVQNAQPAGQQWGGQSAQPAQNVQPQTQQVGTFQQGQQWGGQ